MGDLKKKKAEFEVIAKTKDRDKIPIKSDDIVRNNNISMDERTIEMLKGYIGKFYEMQLEKQRNCKGEKIEDGTISDV